MHHSDPTGTWNGPCRVCKDPGCSRQRTCLRSHDNLTLLGYLRDTRVMIMFDVVGDLYLGWDKGGGTRVPLFYPVAG